MRRRGASRQLATIAILAAALISLNWVPTGYFTVHPGPVRSLSGAVIVSGRAEPANSFYMVSVLAREANVYDLARAVADPEAGLWTKEDVYGGLPAERYLEESRAAMEQSQKTASYLAFRESGYDVTPDSPSPLDVSVNSGEVMGPSAGLAFALQMISQLKGTDLTGGRKVAATGVLTQDGQVSPVGGIAQKALSCRKSGIELFLVPAANAAEAGRYAGDMKVVGVRSLTDALRNLSGHDTP